MKRYIIVLIGLGIIILGVYLFKDKTIEYTTPEVIEKEVIKEVKLDNIEERIKAAQKAEMDTIETAAKNAYDSEKSRLLAEVEGRILREIQTEIDERATAAEKVAEVY